MQRMRAVTLTTVALSLLFLIGCGSSGSTDSAPREITVDQLQPDIRTVYSDPVFGPLCTNPLKCDDIVVIDCGSATDGPKNYYNNLTGEVIMFCGGACMAPQAGNPKSCVACPPTQWTCT